MVVLLVRGISLISSRTKLLSMMIILLKDDIYKFFKSVKSVVLRREDDIATKLSVLEE